MSSPLHSRFAQETALGALLHFIALALLAACLFLLIHIPPRAASLDPLILFFHWIYEGLYLPIAAIRWLWPGETSPWWLNLSVRIIGHGVVGVAGATGFRLWRRRGFSGEPG